MKRQGGASATKAIKAICAELSPEIVGLLDGAPDHVLESVVLLAEFVAVGQCSAAQAAETLTVAVESARAIDRGRLTEEAAGALMVRLARIQFG